MASPPSDLPELSARALDEARLEILRKRVAWFRIAVGAILIADAAIAYTASFLWQERPLRRPGVVGLIVMVLMGFVVVLAPRLKARWRNAPQTLPSLIRKVSLIVIASVFGQVAGAEVLAPVVTRAARALSLLGPGGNAGPMFPLLGFTALVYGAASLIVPWTLREALRPACVLWVLYIVLAAIPSGDSRSMQVAGFVALTLALIPGLLITAVRTGRLRERLGAALLRTRYGEVQRELATARRIHERLFPKPRFEGEVRFSYRYEPMRQIGGDYLDATFEEGGAVMFVLVDVTGHGIAAALAVNRIHGEIKRVLRESAGAGPLEVILALGSYVHLTLADESVFATVAALRISPREKRLTYCNAGHPPPLARVGGSVAALEPTAMMLGPVPSEMLGAEEVSLAFGSGDAVVVYSDGAFECADESGKQLGLAGLRAIVEGTLASEQDAERIVARVHDSVLAHSPGPPQDDTLIIAVTLD